MSSPLAALSGLVSGLLDRSRDRFSRLRPGGQALTLGIVVLVTLATTFGIVALGAAFDATIDREVTVDNSDRPPESTCETFGEDDDSVFAEQCDRPDRIDVDVGEELQSAAGDYVGYALIGVPIWWAIFALALHGGARLAGGAGSVGDSFTIAAWALAAELVRLAVGLAAAIWYALATAAVEGTTIEAIATDRDRRGDIGHAGTASGRLCGRDRGPVGRGRRRAGGLSRSRSGVAGAVAGVLAALGLLLAAL